MSPSKDEKFVTPNCELSPNEAILIATLKNIASFHLPFSQTF